MTSSLEFRYRFDDTDDGGWLGVSVNTANFSGHGGFWVHWQDVERFAEELAAYPISPEKPIKATWGFEPGLGDAVIVGIEIAPANPTGDLRVRVQLGDHTEPSKRLQTYFDTNYTDLQDFRAGIGRLMARQIDQAVLSGR